MASKAVIATGASSGLVRLPQRNSAFFPLEAAGISISRMYTQQGFEVARQVLLDPQSTPHRLIVGARDVARAQAAFAGLGFDAAKHSVTVLPVELTDLRSVRDFAGQAVKALGAHRLDYLFLNAGLAKGAAAGPGPHGSRWCEALLVNHLSQHYLTHLLRGTLEASKSRVVVVSSGAVRNGDPAKLDNDMRADGGAETFAAYTGSKFVQLLGAHYWRRALQGTCTVVAVSPGLIPDTGIFRHADAEQRPSMASNDAKTVEEGARSLLRAFEATDIPEDPEQIFLTSWGEWWPKSVYERSLDRDLQDKWCPSREKIEKEAWL